MEKIYKKARWLKAPAALLTALLLLAGCAAWAAPAGSGGSAPEAAGDAGTLGYVAEMDKNTVMTIEITADADEWQAMLDNASAREYIPADITINGVTVENVGIRTKGNSSLSTVARDEDSDRYGFKIKFDEYVEGQSWLGLDKLVLNGNYADASSMKEYLSYEIMEYIGVAAPLFAYADIRVNGGAWGLYLAVEDLDKGYMERVYGDEGELYKPENMEMDGAMQQLPDGFSGDMPADGAGGMPQFPAGRGEGGEGEPAPNSTDATAPGDGEAPPALPEGQAGEGSMAPGAGGAMPDMGGGVSLVYTDDEISSYANIFDNDRTKTDESDHRRLIEAIKSLNEGTDLEASVDVDANLRYLAAHTMVVNLDSYSGSFGHNYFLYENGGQITMLPWDYNMAFGGFQSGSAADTVNFPIDTPVSGVDMEDRPLISRLLEVPDYLEAYHQYLQQIVDGCFADGQFEKRVDEIDAMISGYIEKDANGFYTHEEYQAAVAELKKLGALRAESVQGQLDGTIPATAEGQQAEPDKLLDASGVDMAALGSMGGGQGGFEGGFGGRGEGTPGGFALPEGLEMDTVRQAMEIVAAAGESGLSDEQKRQLYALGLTDEQIDDLLQMPMGQNGGFGAGLPAGGAAGQ